MENTNLSPALYLLPVGMSDATPERVVPQFNIEIMREIRHFIVENIRTARRWIRKCDPGFNFEGVEFYELNNHTAPMEVEAMMAPLKKGQPMGVMSEAGCPAVADPGADVVGIAQREGIKVVPLVGPSSILLGLMGSGFNGQSFCFHGYLPIDEKERVAALRRLEGESRRENRTQIFIETPYRNNRLLGLLSDTLASTTRLCVACDLTDPLKETLLTLSAGEWKNKDYDYSKRPSIFLLYAGEQMRGDLLNHSGKGGKKR